VNLEEGEEGYEEDVIEPLLQECTPFQSCHTKRSSVQVTHSPSSPSASDDDDDEQQGRLHQQTPH
jgi:hypothetical protein